MPRFARSIPCDKAAFALLSPDKNQCRAKNICVSAFAFFFMPEMNPPAFVYGLPMNSRSRLPTGIALSSSMLKK